MGSYGSKWKHGWIPLNPVATALKLKQLKAGGGHQRITHAGHSITIAKTHRGTFGAVVEHRETGASHYLEHDSQARLGRMARSHAHSQREAAKASVPKRLSPNAQTAAANAVLNAGGSQREQSRAVLGKAPDGYKTRTKRDSFTTEVHTDSNEFVGRVEKRAEGHYVAHHESTASGNAAETSYTHHGQAVRGLINQHETNRETIAAARAEAKRRKLTTSEGVDKVTRVENGFTDTASNGKQYDHNATTGMVHRRDGALVGTMHQLADGSWNIEGVNGSLPAHNVRSRKQAINGLAVAHDLHLNRLEAAKAKKAETDAAASTAVKTARDEGIERSNLISKIMDGRRNYHEQRQIESEALLKGSHEAAMEHLTRLYKEKRAADIASAQRERSRLETTRKKHFAPEPKRRPVTKDSDVMAAARAEMDRRLGTPFDVGNDDANKVADKIREGLPVTHKGRAGHVIARYGSVFDTYHPPTEGQNGYYMRHTIRTRRGKKEIVSEFGGHSSASAPGSAPAPAAEKVLPTPSTEPVGRIVLPNTPAEHREAVVQQALQAGDTTHVTDEELRAIAVSSSPWLHDSTRAKAEAALEDRAFKRVETAIRQVPDLEKHHKAKAIAQGLQASKLHEAEKRGAARALKARGVTV